MKIIKLLAINLFIAISLFFIIDYCVFCKQTTALGCDISYFQNMTKKLGSINAARDYVFNLSPHRKPLNEQNNLKSIILTGCSFIYGEGLKEEEILSYGLSELMKNPVYNFASLGWGLNHTLFLLESGIISQNIKQKPAVFIYTYADFHILRMTMPNMMFETTEILYKLDNGKLTLKTRPFVISRFSSLSLLREKTFEYFKNNNKQYRNYLKLLLKQHFIQMKQYIDKNFENTKFIILVYFESPIFEEIAKDLEKENIIIVRIKEDYGYNLKEQQYLLPDGHPNAKVWKLVTPKLYKTLSEYGI